MRLALLGIDDLAWSVIRAIADSTGHSVETICDVGDELANIRLLFPQAAHADSSESLIATRTLEAVVVASGPDPQLRYDQLKRLAQAGMPLLVMHPVCDMMQAYELEMTRRETGGVIVPYAPDWSHPAWLRITEWLTPRDDGIADHADSHLEQVICERLLTDRSRRAVRKQLSRDELLMRRILGAITSVSAAGVGFDEPAYGNLSLCLTGPNSATARWSVANPARERVSTMTVVCRHGTAQLRMPDHPSPWSLEFVDHDQAGVSFPEFRSADDVLARLEQALAGAPVEPGWPEACLSLETVDSIDRSLRRKRAVDLNTSERSEENAFKGYMAATGCLILMAVLLVFFGLAVFEGFRMPLRDSATPLDTEREPGWPLWLRLWPVYPLVAFLLLQFLLRFARGK